MNQVQQMKSRTIIIPLILIITVFVSIFHIFGNNQKQFEYIGMKKCEVCHREEAIGNQCVVWDSVGHARAYNILGTKQALDIAEKISVKEPQNDLKCLKCHTTGGGRAEITKTEGVGCEACHGPGSGYYELGNHVDYSDPTRVLGYMRAIKNGMTPILGIVGKHLRSREKLCTGCHKDERPCAPPDKKSRLKIKMTIQVIDKLQRGEIRLKHPLRR